MTQAQLIDLDLVDKIVAHIPSNKWDTVQRAIVKRIVDNMPGAVVERLTGSYDDFDQAEQTLNNYYTGKTDETIVDAIKLIGLEDTIYLLDSLQLNDGIPSSDAAEVSSMQRGQTQDN